MFLFLLVSTVICYTSELIAEINAEKAQRFLNTRPIRSIQVTGQSVEAKIIVLLTDVMCVVLIQVINAARVLAARPRSKAAQDNMEMFRDAWEKQVRLLTEAVDDITTIDDFLAVSGKLHNVYVKLNIQTS